MQALGALLDASVARIDTRSQSPWVAKPGTRFSFSRNECISPVSFLSGSTRNQDVFFRNWLVIDLDPVRPTKVSSTAQEKDAALAVSGDVRAFLAGLGWGN